MDGFEQVSHEQAGWSPQHAKSFASSRELQPALPYEKYVFLNEEGRLELIGYDHTGEEPPQPPFKHLKTRPLSPDLIGESELM